MVREGVVASYVLSLLHGVGFDGWCCGYTGLGGMTGGESGMWHILLVQL